MPPKQADVAPQRRSLSPDPIDKDPNARLCGAFIDDRRVTTPSGAFVAAPRTMSALERRMRGLPSSSSSTPFGGGRSQGLPQEFFRTPSPSNALWTRRPPSQVGARGSASLLSPLFMLNDDGRRTSTTTAPATQPPRGSPDIATDALSNQKLNLLRDWIGQFRAWFRLPSVKGLDSFRCQAQRMPRSPELLWKSEWLATTGPLHHLPASVFGCEAHPSQDQVARASTLTAALLTLKCKVDQGELPLFPDRGSFSAEEAETLQKLFSHTIVLADDGNYRLRYTDGSKHVVVVIDDSVFSLDVFDSDGRALTASELQERLTEAVDAVSKVPSRYKIPLASLTHLSRENNSFLQHEAKEGCQANSDSLALLSTCLACVVLSSRRDLAIDDTPNFGVEWPQWHGAPVTISVFQDGAACFRIQSLLCPTTEASNCAAWITNAANCDPLLKPPTRQPVALRAVRRTPTAQGSRPPIPVAASPKKAASPSSGKGKGAATADQALHPAPDLLTPVTVNVPAPEAPGPARRLPMWMPTAYECDTSKTVIEPPSSSLTKSFEVTVSQESLLHVAAVCALKVLKQLPASAPPPIVLMSTESPKVSSLTSLPIFVNNASRLTVCCSSALVNALSHLSEDGRCGPLPAELAAACGGAVKSIDDLRTTGVCHASLMIALDKMNCLTDHALDVAPLLAPDLIIAKAGPPKDASTAISQLLAWSLDSRVAVPAHKDIPFLSYAINPPSRSAVHPSVGMQLTCTLTNVAEEFSLIFPSLVRRFVELLQRNVQAEEKVQRTAGRLAFRNSAAVRGMESSSFVVRKRNAAAQGYSER